MTEELNLEEIESELRVAANRIQINREQYQVYNEQTDDIAAQIEKLRQKLGEVQSKKRRLNHEHSELVSHRTFMASQKELALRKQITEQALSETASIVEELFKNYPGWNFPNEAGLQVHDYQKMDVTMAVHAFRSNFTGFMNANDMSMGKTMEAFLTLKALIHIFEKENERVPRILWLTKTSILKTGGTVREGKKWFPELQMIAVHGNMVASERETMFKMIGDFGLSVITNYEAVRTTDNLRAIDWDYIVMDEVHKLKGGANPSGQTGIFKAVKSICETAKIIMLSGTPMVNRVAEMWSYLNIFDPERFDNLRKFENAFTSVRESGVEIDADRLLDTALKGRVVRRSKLEVNLQLPSITPQEQRAVMLEMLPQQRKVYDQMRDQFFIWLDEQNPDEIFTATAIIAQLIRLRQINVWPVLDFNMKDAEGNIVGTQRLDVRESSKIDDCLDKIEEAQDQVVVFCGFNAPLYEVQRRVEKELGGRAMVLSGENSKNIDKMEIGFQNGEIDVLCINSAMGEGLNLQKSTQWKGGSSYVGLLDKWWNSARDDQCINRVWRQGSEIPVTVWEWENEDSVDQFINEMQAEKDAQIKGVSESQKLRPSDWASVLRGKV